MVHPIGQAALNIQNLSHDGVRKGTKIRSLNRRSVSRFFLGLPLMFSRKLTVWDPHKNTHVYTSVSKAGWKKVKSLAARPDDSIAGLSKKSLATRKKLALEIIRKSGDASGLSVLDRAPAQQLCIIARSLARYGHDQTYREGVFNALREAQSQWQAMSMDPQTLQMVNEFVSEGRKLQATHDNQPVRAQYSKAHLEKLEAQKPKQGIPTQAEFGNQFRKFVADLISEDERDLDQSTQDPELSREKRLRQVFEKHQGVVIALSVADDSVSPQKLAQSCGVSALLIMQIQNIIERIGIPDPFASKLDRAKALKEGLSQLDPSQFSSLADQVDMETRIYDLNRFGQTLRDNIPQKPGNFGQFLSRVFARYFESLSPADRRAVVASYLRGAGLKDSKQQHLVAALKGGGPYLLKILQLVGDTVRADTPEGRELKEALSELKDSLLPIAPDIQKAMLMDVLKHNAPAIRELRSVRSLGAASVGETLMAQATLENGQTQDVVIKLLKPGVDQRAARERVFMEEIARDLDGMEETFAGIADQIDRELDLSREADNLKLAEVYRNAGVNSLQPVRAVKKLDASQEFMFMEKASGVTVKDKLQELGSNQGKPLRKDSLEERVEIKDRLKEGLEVADRLKTLSAVWLKQGLFGEGFFHGDLHSGNMMIGDVEQQRSLLTLIDFGNAGSLSSTERAGMLKLMLAAENRYPEVFVDTLATMVGPKSQAVLQDAGKREALIGEVTTLFKDPTTSGPKRMMEAFNLANQYDVAVPNPITNFSRSQNMLDRTIKDLNAINESNWQVLHDAGGNSEEKPASVVLSETFKATVKSQKRQIILLTGLDGWNMRTKNPNLEVDPMPEDGLRDELDLQQPVQNQSGAGTVKEEVLIKPVGGDAQSSPPQEIRLISNAADQKLDQMYDDVYANQANQKSFASDDEESESEFMKFMMKQMMQ